MVRITVLIFTLVLLFTMAGNDISLSETAGETTPKTTSVDSPIVIKSDRSVIIPGKDTIRSWEGIGNVSITYDNEKINFVCSADYVKFTREGTEEYTDKIEFEGNINGVINGWNVKSEQLVLLITEDIYSLQSDTELVIYQDQYTFITKQIVFDSSTGVGVLERGGSFEFVMDDAFVPGAIENNQANVFTDCIRFDYSGGIFESPDITIHCNITSDGDLNPRTVFIKGGEIHPLNADPHIPSSMEFNMVEFDIAGKNFLATDGITLRNGSCVMKAETAHVDWDDREMIFEGNVEISREMIDFNAGLIRISWEENGDISLIAEKSPQMCIRVSEDAIDGFMN